MSSVCWFTEGTESTSGQSIFNKWHNTHMALVTSSSLTISPNIYEWPRLNELYTYHDPRHRPRQVSFLVRNANCGNPPANNSSNKLILASGSIMDNFSKSTSELSTYSMCRQSAVLDNVCEPNKTYVSIDNHFNTPIEKHTGLSYKPTEPEFTRQPMEEILTSSEQEHYGQLLQPEFSATSEFHKDSVISDTAENTNLVPANEDKDCKNSVSPKSGCFKRKKWLKKVRRKSMRKWKPFDSTELGFRITEMPYLLNDASGFSNINSSDDSSLGEGTQPEELGCSMENNTAAQNDAENIKFFRSVGIDVFNFDYNDESEDLLQWDGVCFSTKKPASQPPQKLNQCNKPKVKSKLAANSQTGSSPINVKLNEDERTHTFSPSSTVFSRIKKCDSYRLFELECSSSKRIYIRRDRDRRQEKPHKAVKSKNSRFILQNVGRKRMYMHHRLIKMHNLDLEFRGSLKSYSIPPMPKSKVAIDVAKESFKADRRTLQNDQPAVVQNLKHALHETTCTGHLDGDLANFLITLQHRDMTPEDYDMLLRLDDTVKPKTVSKNVLEKLRTETIGPNGAEQGSSEWEPLCTICMEPYSLGQERKFLPCNHDFHTPCIDKWLKNSSLNCPLDGLPIESS